MLATLAQKRDATLQMPGQYSTFAEGVDFSYYFVFWICVFFFVLVVGLVVYFAIKYRQTPTRHEGEHTPTHHTALEMTWTIIPLVIVLAIFYFGFREYVNFSRPPGDAYQIDVYSRTWAWEFVYPNGASSSTLYLPADRDVELTLHSDDVIHSFFVPEFRVKRDAVPERNNFVWFRALWREGSDKIQPIHDIEAVEDFPFDPVEEDFAPDVIVHTLFCAEYCGQDHSTMIAPVVTFRTEEEFRKTVERLGEPQEPVEAGQSLGRTQGCLGCHSVQEDQVLTGPSFYNLYGSERELDDGRTVTADVEYLTRAIRDPRADTVEGFPDVMQPYPNLTDEDIANIIAYLRSLSEHWEGEPEPPELDEIP